MNDALKKQVESYIQTSSYNKLIEELQKKHPSISNEHKDYVIRNLAYNYFRFVGNEKNVWEDEKVLLQEFPYIVSIAEIVSHTAAQKHIYSIPSISFHCCEPFFQKYSLQCSRQRISILSNEIVIITFAEVFESEEQMRATGLNSIGRSIWKEIEKNKINCGYCALRMHGSSKDSNIFLELYRELDYKKARKNAHAGFREDLEESYRSAWEANVARLLLQKRIPFSYESEFFKLTDQNYIPDFILPNNIILEIKGIWDNDSLSKVSEFTKIFKQRYLLPIDSDMYFDLNRKFKDSIANWEKTPVSIEERIVSVVGLAYVEDKTVFQEIDIDTEVCLIRECHNPYDCNAIAVTTKDGRCIGHLSTEWACVYAPKLDAGIHYRTIVASISEKVIKIKIKRSNPHQEIFYDFLNSLAPNDNEF